MDGGVLNPAEHSLTQDLEAKMRAEIETGVEIKRERMTVCYTLTELQVH